MGRLLHRLQLVLLLAPFVAVGTALVFGLTLPRGHRFGRAVTVEAAAERAFALLADVEGWPRWSARVRAVEALPEHDGRRTWRLKLGSDRRGAYLTLADGTPPQRLVFELADSAGPFRGVWHFAVVPLAGGCRVELVEEARYGNPFARFLVHLASDKARLAEDMLRDLARALGEASPEIERMEPAP
ncbi:MAG: hypothetical protein D6696_03345 [Acidobacteria bacterium]|nr:MAG: hypothetical protein D6696_03345 [Acidobacteriota bacterium]